jgi:hypothetical protein
MLRCPYCPHVGGDRCGAALAGKIVLWTKADSVTRFDQLEIRSLH